MVSAGALTQLAALGPQNTWLNANAVITFWKGGYRRYTNFAKAEIEQPFQNGSTTLGGPALNGKIDRAGDLLGQCYLYAQFSAITQSAFNPPIDYAYFTNSVGHAMMTDVTVAIGSHDFDKHQGEFLEVWESISAPAEKKLTEMIGFAETVDTLVTWARDVQNLYVPFRFWFNRFHEQALPLIALQYHEVKLTINTRSIANLYITVGSPSATAPTLNNILLLCNFIYLDTMERRIFAQHSHEYLIDQVQFTGSETRAAADGTKSYTLAFNHPTKELIWVVRSDANATALDWFNFSGPAKPNGLPSDPITSAKIQLNGHDRTISHLAPYWRGPQPWEHHTRIPNRFIYLYSFALYPEDVKPSGSANLSRIDKTVLQLVFNSTAPYNVAGTVWIWARSTNVVKIISGMAGLLYAN
jgi:hypothetical protein